MKRLAPLIAIVALLMSAGISRPAHAHNWDDLQLGIGAVFGMPTGLTMDIRMGSRAATNVAVGMGTLTNDPYIHAELRGTIIHLSHQARLAIPLYIGAGGYLAGQGREVGGELNLGARFSLGVAFELRVPVQFFAEAALRSHMLSIGHDREPGLGVGGAAGFKIFF